MPRGLTIKVPERTPAMSRSQARVLALAVPALFAVGCAHCDTCDDFPVPQNAGSLGSYTEAVPTLAPGQIVTPAPAGAAAPLPTTLSPFQDDAVPAAPDTKDATQPATDATPPGVSEPPASPPTSPGTDAPTANPASPPTAL
jgi:hypothetical protein